MSKSALRVGDLIQFHEWGAGGFLFGVIIEHEDSYYHSKLNIWRPDDIYLLQARGIDDVQLIEKIEDVKDYDLHEFQNFLDEVQENNIRLNIGYAVT